MEKADIVHFAQYAITWLNQSPYTWYNNNAQVKLLFSVDPYVSLFKKR